VCACTTVTGAVARCYAGVSHGPCLCALACCFGLPGATTAEPLLAELCPSLGSAQLCGLSTRHLKGESYVLRLDPYTVSSFLHWVIVLGSWPLTTVGSLAYEPTTPAQNRSG
jgi:hypothetical protein